MINKEVFLKEYYNELEDKLRVLVDIVHKSGLESEDTMERVLWFTEGYLKATVTDISNKVNILQEGK
ncbi:MAG: hypothetical protein ACRDA3_13150 [Peptostreptococcaceae bacterium]